MNGACRKPLVAGAGCLLAALAASVALPAESRAERYVAKLGSMPDFYQADRAYGPLPRHGAAYCGPTAVSNALVWLDTNGFGKLLPGACPGPQEQFQLIRILGSEAYMGTDPIKGTGPAGIMRGIQRYCAEKGYVARVEYAGWRTRRHRVSETPALPWLLARTRGTSSLIINLGWYKRDAAGKSYTRIGGHYVTAVGYESRSRQHFIYVHDPAKRNHPKQRNSLARCPVRCELRPLPAGATLRTQKGRTLPAEGYPVLDGLRIRRGADCAIIDGAVAFSLLPQ